MGLLLFGITEGLKRPIKLLTKKIKTERARKLVNLTIMIIPIGFGMLCEYLYNVLFLKQGFDIISALTYGMTAIVLYAPFETIFYAKGKKEIEDIGNPYDTEEGQATVELIEKITADKKLDAKDIPAVKDFYKKIK